MTAPDRTIAELEAQGFTHIEARCGCGQIVALPFRLLRLQGAIVDATAFADLAGRLVCQRCRAKPAPAQVRPWRQYLDGEALTFPGR